MFFSLLGSFLGCPFYMGMNPSMFTCFQSGEMRKSYRPVLIQDRRKCYVNGGMKGEAYSWSQVQKHKSHHIK